jgi:hypothetical protein
MDGNDSDSGSVAAGANGDAIIAVEFGSRVFASERRRGQWHHPVRSVTQPHNPAGGSVFTPRMAIRSDGTTILTWTQRDGTTDRIYESVYANGAWADPLGHHDHLSPANAGTAQQPWVVFDSAGAAVVAWEQYTANGGTIFKSEYRNGSWRSPTGPDDGLSPLLTHAQDVHVAAGPNEHVIVAWAQHDLQTYRIYLAERRYGVWARPTLADGISPAGSDAFRPRVAFTPDGDALVAWVQSDGTSPQVFIAELRGGRWRHPASLADNVSPDGTAARAVEVAMSGAAAVVVWRQDVGAGSSLFASEHRAGAWRHPASLADRFAVGLHVNEFAVAMDAAGDVVVPYTAADATQNWAVYLSEYRGGAWRHAAGPGARINPGSTPASQPAIAVDGQGAVTVIWRQSDGVFQKTYLSEYR